MDHNEKVRRSFSHTAENYRYSAVHARGKSLFRLVELVEPQPHWRVLDVATGAGHTAAALASKVDHVVATDLTQAMLEQAGELAKERGLSNIELRLEDVHALSFSDNSFDLVTCRVAAHHFRDPQQFVTESARVLRPGGLFALVDNIAPGDTLSARWINDLEQKRDPSHRECLTVSSWRDLAESTGLHVRDLEVHAKRFAFDDWTGRMNVDEDTRGELARRLAEAPPAVQEFLKPSFEPIIEFQLQELIMVARKR